MKTFKQLDLNNDGVLSKNELLKGFQNCRLFISEDRIQQLMSIIDRNQSGQIDYSEFVAAAIDKESIFTNQRMKVCFDLFDIDSDGGISVQEFKQIFDGENK